MATSFNALGGLIRSIRQAAGLSQAELAAQSRVPTSRSAVAHLEQGVRLPAPRIVASLCAALSIPEALWRPYFRHAANATFVQRSDSALIESTLPQTIAVGGIVGAGKSTLIRSLAPLLGYTTLSEARPGIAYLKDLAQDPPRWAFETQIAFLSHKAIELQALLSHGVRVMIDRSLSEDAQIFAEYWKRRGAIAERAYPIYTGLAEHFLHALPAPEMLIVCRCSTRVAYERTQMRRRGDSLHTLNHVEMLNEMYEFWLSREHDSPVYVIDTEEHDVRDESVIETIAQDIRAIFFRVLPTEQLPLFSEYASNAARSTQSDSPKILKRINRVVRPQGSLVEESRVAPSRLLAYLAAPFTSAASIPTHNQELVQSLLFQESVPHGRIPRGPYRNMLLSAEHALAQCGVSTWIPHRDSNRWGRRQMTPEEAAQECTEQVLVADFIVCLLGNSCGAHYECGLARGAGKPIVFIDCLELRSSFMAAGLATVNSPDSLTLRTDSISSIPPLLESTAMRRFLAQHFALPELP